MILYGYIGITFLLPVHSHEFSCFYFSFNSFTKYVNFEQKLLKNSRKKNEKKNLQAAPFTVIWLFAIHFFKLHCAWVPSVYICCICLFFGFFGAECQRATWTVIIIIIYSTTRHTETILEVCNGKPFYWWPINNSDKLTYCLFLVLFHFSSIPFLLLAGPSRHMFPHTYARTQIHKLHSNIWQ